MTDDASISNQSPTSDRCCVAVALSLSLLHILTVFGITYRNPGYAADYAGFVNLSILLAPTVALLLLRKTCVLVVTLAVPISISFAGRAYYFYLKISTGTTYGGGKGDWAFWLATLTGAASIAIIMLWMFYCISLVFIRLVSSNSSPNLRK